MIETIIAILLAAFAVALLILSQSKASRKIEELKRQSDERLSAERVQYEKKMESERLAWENKLTEERHKSESAKEELQKQLTQREIENSRLSERVKFFEEEKQRIAEENESRFRNLATEILDSNSKKFKEQNEQRIAEILQPFKSDLEQFKKTVTEAYSTEARERFSLMEKLKDLEELNRTIGNEAKELTVALKGNSKIQGDWGEMILETILEKSGLKRDVHFKVQATRDDDGNVLRGDDGKQIRPDVIINYPDGRCVVIDSKVSLTAYVDYVNAEADKDVFARQHLLSVKKHIKELSETSYQDYVGDKKTDFVMMFIPNEAAYLSAMNLDTNLWQEAYDKRVLIISPTHLISVIRLVEQLWRQDDMKRNVLEIAAEGGKMYDKLVGFVEDMGKIEKNLESARSSFDSAMKKLSTGNGNVLVHAEKLRKLGAKTQKKINSSLLPAEDETEE